VISRCVYGCINSFDWYGGRARMAAAMSGVAMVSMTSDLQAMNSEEFYVFLFLNPTPMLVNIATECSNQSLVDY